MMNNSTLDVNRIASLGEDLQHHRVYSLASSCLHRNCQHSRWYKNSRLVTEGVDP